MSQFKLPAMHKPQLQPLPLPHIYILAAFIRTWGVEPPDAPDHTTTWRPLLPLCPFPTGQSLCLASSCFAHQSRSCKHQPPPLHVSPRNFLAWSLGGLVSSGVKEVPLRMQSQVTGRPFCLDINITSSFGCETF